MQITVVGIDIQWGCTDRGVNQGAVQGYGSLQGGGMQVKVWHRYAVEEWVMELFREWIWILIELLAGV